MNAMACTILAVLGAFPLVMGASTAFTFDDITSEKDRKVGYWLFGIGLVFVSPALFMLFSAALFG